MAEKKLYAVVCGGGYDGVHTSSPDYYIKTDDPVRLAQISMLSYCSRGIKKNIEFIIHAMECRETTSGISCYLDKGPQGQTASTGAWKIVVVFESDPPSGRWPKAYHGIEDFFSRRELVKYHAAFEKELPRDPIRAPAVPITVTPPPNSTAWGPQMQQEPLIDRAAIRRMVEDFWRSLVLYGRHLGETRPNMTSDEAARLILDFGRRFQERNQATAASMPPEQARLFLQTIDEEDAICFDEHQRNKDTFYRRLGLNWTDAPSYPQYVGHHRQSIGEMVVRTAIRATIWEAIWTLFRR